MRRTTNSAGRPLSQAANAATTMPLIQPTGPVNNSTLNIAGLGTAPQAATGRVGRVAGGFWRSAYQLVGRPS